MDSPRPGASRELGAGESRAPQGGRATMLKLAMKLKSRSAAESEKKTAAAAAEVAAEAAAAAAALAGPSHSLPQKKTGGDPPKTSKSFKPFRSPLAREAPSERFLTEKERKKIEKTLLEQRRKEEKKREKERKKMEKMLKKKKKKGPEAQAQAARGPEVDAAADADDEGAGEGAEEGAVGGVGGAAAGGTSRAWAEWDTDSDEEEIYYHAPRVGGVVWRPGPAKAGALSAHLPLVVFLVFSVRSPSWVLNFLLQKRTEQGRGCGFIFGATCCFRMFLGCAFFSYLGGRSKRRGRGRAGASGAFGSSRGGRRRGRDERLI